VPAAVSGDPCGEGVAVAAEDGPEPPPERRRPRDDGEERVRH
jgi:hypothetical protein